MAMLFIKCKEYFAYRLSMCVEKKIGYAHTCHIITYANNWSEECGPKEFNTLYYLFEREGRSTQICTKVLESSVQKMEYGEREVGGIKYSKNALFRSPKAIAV